MLLYLNLISFLLLLLLILSFITNTFFRNLLSGIIAIISGLQLFSIQVGNSLIDHKFIVHANLNDVIISKFLYPVETLLSLVAIAVSYFLLSKFSCSFFVKNSLSKVFKFLMIIVLFISLSFKNGFFYEIYRAIEIQMAPSSDFESAMYSLGIKEFTNDSTLEVKPGKNIIILSLESLEAGYLRDRNKALTPNLNKLKQDWTYLDMQQNEGSSWTSGSLYTVLTGFPALYKGDGNGFFYKASKSKLLGLGKILKTAGYESKFFVGNADFSGTRDILKVNDIDSVYDKRNFPMYPLGKYGLHDKDLFKEFQDHLFQQAKNKRPFFYFLSTTSTHAPNGVYDERLEGSLPTRRDHLSFMISAVDKMVGDLINELKKNKILDNTVIYIFPDHLKHGNDRVFRNTGKRGLYIMSNASKNDLLKSVDGDIYQIDLRNIILDGAEIKHNTQTLSNFIRGDKNDFIKEHIVEIASVNNSSLKRSGYWTDDLFISLNNEQVQVSFSDTEINFPTDKSDFTLLFNSNFRLSKKLNFHVKDIPEDNLAVYISKNKNGLDVWAKFKNRGHLLKKGPEIYFTREDQEYIQNLPFVSDLTPIYLFDNRTKKIAYGVDKKWKSARSHARLPFMIAEANIKVKYKCSSDAEPVMYLKECYNAPYTVPKVIVEKFLPHSTEDEQIIVVLNKKSISDPKIFFENIGTGDFKVLSIEIEGVGVVRKYNNRDFTKFTKDTSRFIADAGGQVKVENYANSKEALDRYYENGFRRFELDLRKTSDDYLVAVHNWDGWAHKTKFSGSLPPTYEQFMNQSSFDALSPMGGDEIVEWFDKHPDATLVTNKCNDAKYLLSVFPFHNRLILKLSTEESIVLADKLGFNNIIMPYKLLKKDKAIEFIMNDQVKYIGLPQSKIIECFSLIQKAKRYGVKTLVWGLGEDSSNNAEHLMKTYMNHIYGFYTDASVWELD